MDSLPLRASFALDGDETVSARPDRPAKPRQVAQYIEGVRAYAVGLVGGVAAAATVADALDEVRGTLIPVGVMDRLDDLAAPVDDEEGHPLPSMSLVSLRAFLNFSLRAVDLLAPLALDDRLVPGRTDSGELEILLLDAELGDLSIRFLASGLAWLALTGDGRHGFVEVATSDLLSDRDPFQVRRWL